MVRENLVFTLNQVEKDDDITWKEKYFNSYTYILRYYSKNRDALGMGVVNDSAKYCCKAHQAQSQINKLRTVFGWLTHQKKPSPYHPITPYLLIEI